MIIKGQQSYFQTRFSPDQRREILWRTPYRHPFSRLISPEDCVLELGAGYGHFINQVVARRRIALDQWEGFTSYLQLGVESRVGDVTDLSFLDPGSVDFAFASNLFVYLTQDQFAVTFEQLRHELKGSGTLNVLPPDYRFAYREYFDDYTHVPIYSDRSLCDFLRGHGFRVLECHPRFLLHFPVSPLLIRACLTLPFKPMGKQMLLRASQA